MNEIISLGNNLEVHYNIIFEVNFIQSIPHTIEYRANYNNYPSIYEFINNRVIPDVEYICKTKLDDILYIKMIIVIGNTVCDFIIYKMKDKERINPIDSIRRYNIGLRYVSEGGSSYLNPIECITVIDRQNKIIYEIFDYGYIKVIELD